MYYFIIKTLKTDILLSVFNNKGKLIKIISILIIISTILYNLFFDAYAESRNIIIDAGHGGFDGGAVSIDGTSEKNINLNISLCLGEMLRFCGENIIFTRTEDNAVNTEGNDIKSKKISDMKNRLSIMNNNPKSVFVSIHLNKFTSTTANGAQVFYSQNIEKSKELSEYILDRIKSNLQPDNKRTVKKGTDSIYLLKNATVPSVIVECGFLSNKNECLLLKDEEYQAQLAFSIYCGIYDYYLKQLNI